MVVSPFLCFSDESFPITRKVKDSDKIVFNARKSRNLLNASSEAGELLKNISSPEIIFCRRNDNIVSSKFSFCDFFPIDSKVTPLQVQHLVFYHSLTSPEESFHSNNRRCRCPGTHLAFCCIPTQGSGEEAVPRQETGTRGYFTVSDINCSGKYKTKQNKIAEKIRCNCVLLAPIKIFSSSVTRQQIAASNEDPSICYHANRLLSHKGIDM